MKNNTLLSGECTKERHERVLEKYSRVLRNKTAELVGQGKSEWYGSSYFYKFKPGWGGLFFEKPGVFWKFLGIPFPKYKLRRSMAYVQKIHPHFLACTELLEQARSDGRLHPIFTPVKMGKKNFRPYLRREMKGVFLDEEVDTEWAFVECVRILLAWQLSKIGFSSRIMENFDIKESNITVINIHQLPVYAELTDILTCTPDCEIERITKILELFTRLHDQWVQIMLFDYGTWTRPDGKDKYNR